MRHRKAGFKLGRNTSHRRALLRNLVTSILMEDRVVTTVTKAKAARPHVEKLITLGKRGDRQGGYLRIIRTGFQKGDGAEKAFIELLGAEKLIDEKRSKRADARQKRREEMEKAMAEQSPAEGEGEK